jgi:hypothetical protein
VDLSDNYITINGNIGTGRTIALVALFEQEKAGGYSPKILVPSGYQYNIAEHFDAVEPEEVITDPEDLNESDPVFIEGMEFVEDEVIEEINELQIGGVTRVDMQDSLESGTVP